MNEALGFLRMTARTIPMFQQVGVYRQPSPQQVKHKVPADTVAQCTWRPELWWDRRSTWGEGVKCEAIWETEVQGEATDRERPRKREREGRCCFCILDFSGDHVCGPRREWLPAAVGARPMAGRQSVGQSSPECAHVCVSCCADAVGLCVRVVSVYGTRRVL